MLVGFLLDFILAAIRTTYFLAKKITSTGTSVARRQRSSGTGQQGRLNCDQKKLHADLDPCQGGYFDVFSLSFGYGPFTLRLGIFSAPFLNRQDLAESPLPRFFCLHKDQFSVLPPFRFFLLIECFQMMFDDV